MTVPLMAVVGGVSFAVLFLIVSIACCTVRCFRPQNAAGNWKLNYKGQEQVVNAPFSEKWLSITEKGVVSGTNS